MLRRNLVCSPLILRPCQHPVLLAPGYLLWQGICKLSSWPCLRKISNAALPIQHPLLRSGKNSAWIDQKHELAISWERRCFHAQAVLMGTVRSHFRQKQWNAFYWPAYRYCVQQVCRRVESLVLDFLINLTATIPSINPQFLVSSICQEFIHIIFLSTSTRFYFTFCRI